MWNHVKFIRFIKAKLPFSFRIFLIRILYGCQLLYYSIFTKKCDINVQPTIYFMLSTDYSNLGDHAMSYASIKYLSEKFPDYHIIEISVNDTIKKISFIKKHIKNSDFICLKGGGNIGIQYFREELIRRKIIKLFKQNKVIIFPQTIYFGDSKFGKKQFLKTVDIYNSNVNLETFVRDKFSYDLAENHLNTVHMVPDIVFSLGSSIISNCREKGKLSICLRDDVEGIYSEKFKKNLIDNLQKKYCNIVIFDTIKPYYIALADRLGELKQIWHTIESSELLITDRLHGMIFAYLLKTPCIILKTYNYKLIGQYEWIAKSGFVRLMDNDVDEIIKEAECLLELREVNEVLNFQNYFQKISDVMKNKRGTSNE